MVPTLCCSNRVTHQPICHKAIRDGVVSLGCRLGHTAPEFAEISGQNERCVTIVALIATDCPGRYSEEGEPADLAEHPQCLVVGSEPHFLNFAQALAIHL